MFDHGFDGYMRNAFPADELMPLSCRGRFRDVEANRGDLDDALGNFSLTLIDSLDTLVIMNELEKFDSAVRLVSDSVTFDSDIVVSVFEVNIRVMGGLLSGHVLANYVQNRFPPLLNWYRGQLLLLAQDLGNRLLPSFQYDDWHPSSPGQPAAWYELAKNHLRPGNVFSLRWHNDPRIWCPVPPDW